MIGSEQGPALGFGHPRRGGCRRVPDVDAAAKAMGKVRRAVFHPDPNARAVYDELYDAYV